MPPPVVKTEPASQKTASAASTSAALDAAGKQLRVDAPTPQLETSVACPVRTLLGLSIQGVGGHLPGVAVRNEELASLGYDAEWIVQRSGIRQRYRAPAGTATSDVAFLAAQQAIANAGVEAKDIDLVVLGTMTPDRPAPATACQLQRLLGCNAPAFDINAACSGFMYALTTAAQFVATGASKLALVVGADLMTRTVNPADVKTYPLFGDGAGAVLLGRGTGEQGLLAYSLGADGAGADLLAIPGGGVIEPLTAAGLAEGRQYLIMEGRQVFKWAVRLAADQIRAVLAHAKLAPQDIDHAVLHQANLRILDAVCDEVGLPRERLAVNLDAVGNTSAGSIPLVLDDLNRSSKLQRGQKVLLCGFGAGLTWGTAVWQW